MLLIQYVAIFSVLNGDLITGESVLIILYLFVSRTKPSY
jgi:hypothetical protein